MIFSFYFSFFVLLCYITIQAQTGGSYDLSHNVVASGGGSGSTGGNFKIDGTIGQPSAGTNSTGGTYDLRGGFWTFETLAPTAASVTISGRVMTANGRGISNARITLTAGDGTIRRTQTSSFGFYRFAEVEVGNVYILEAASKRFVFTNPTLVLSVQGEITNADFIAGW